MHFCYFTFLFVYLKFLLINAAGQVAIEVFTEEKEYKSLLKTRPNILILFSKSGMLLFYMALQFLSLSKVVLFSRLGYKRTSETIKRSLSNSQRICHNRLC